MPQSLANMLVHLVFSTKDQLEHHRKFDFQTEFRQLSQLHALEWNEGYVWD